MLPFLYQSETFAIPTYLTLNSLIFTLAVLWAYKRAQDQKISLNNILDVSLVIMISGFIGSRLLHVLFEHPDFYLKNPSMIFRFWNGGFVFYGGALLSVLSCFLFCRIRKISFLKMGDFFSPIIAFGYALGRLGCLAAGCCYGQPTSQPWGIVFREGVEAPPGVPLHPTQLYAFFWEFTVGLVLLSLEKRGRLKTGQLFGLWITLHATGRIIMEIFRADFRGNPLFHLSVSTFISIVLMAVGTTLFIKLKKD